MTVDHIPSGRFRHRPLVAPLIWNRHLAHNAYRRAQAHGKRDDWQGYVNGCLAAHVRRPHPLERYPGHDWTWYALPSLSVGVVYGGRAGKMRVALQRAEAHWSRCRAVRRDYHHAFATKGVGSPFFRNRP